MLPPGLAVRVSEKAWRQSKSEAAALLLRFTPRSRKSLSERGIELYSRDLAVVSLQGAWNYIKQLALKNLDRQCRRWLRRPRGRHGPWAVRTLRVSSLRTRVTAINVLGDRVDESVKEMRSRFGVILTDGQGAMRATCLFGASRYKILWI